MAAIAGSDDMEVMGVTTPVRHGRWPERTRGTWAADPWDPFAEFNRMWDRMGRLFEQSIGTGQEVPDGGWMPVAETEETSDAYVVRAELPGMKREDVDIELRGHELSVSGETREEERGNVLRRHTGRFSYRTTVPSDADAENIKAEMADGVLTVRLPKSAKAQARKIDVGTGASRAR